MAARGFAIHFTARSGSTYLIYRLRENEKITARAEVFGNLELPGGVEQNADNQIAFLRKFWRPYSLDKPNYDGVSRGFKVQFRKDLHQVLSYSRYLKMLHSYDVAKIFLYRRNHVKQVVSAIRAQQVKQLTREEMGEERAHVFDSDVQKRVQDIPPVRIGPLEIRKKLHELELHYKVLDEFKSKVGDCHDIYYEDMIAAPEKVLGEVYDMIGHGGFPVSSVDPVKKITDNNLENIIENFDEIAEFLKTFPSPEGASYYEQLLER